MVDESAAERVKKVGAEIASIPLHEMITELAKGIAWGQYELDKVGVDVTKMMGVPGVVSIGDENLSMIEAGFLPSFYHFVDTILELKMDVSLRQEDFSSVESASTLSGSRTEESSLDYKWKLKISTFLGSVTASGKGSNKRSTTTAYSRSLNTRQSRKYNQDLSSSSLMRTKIVPVPTPQVLLERIQVLLKRLRAEAQEEANLMIKEGDTRDPFQIVEELLLQKVEEKILRRL